MCVKVCVQVCVYVRERLSVKGNVDFASFATLSMSNNFVSSSLCAFWATCMCAVCLHMC